MQDILGTELVELPCCCFGSIFVFGKAMLMGAGLLEESSGFKVGKEMLLPSVRVWKAS